MPNLPYRFVSGEPIRLAEQQSPQLLVVIDAEEEFDWSSPVSRKEIAVSAMQSIDIVQSLLDDYGIKPCYVIDHPVVSQATGYEKLLGYHQSGRCEIGAHLHPWVTPPYTETLSPANSFVGNLPREIELQKILSVTESIQEKFGFRPTIYKAGRYGYGPNTLSILKELQYEIDLSACPPVDFSREGGPDFSRAHPEPFWLTDDKSILEVPVTGAFVGWAGAYRRGLYGVAGRLAPLKMQGMLARTGLVDRLMLSPEGFDFDDHVRITRFLYARGVRTFTWNFHSTSLVPGLTPYVQSKEDLDTFLNSFKQYFDFFFNELGGKATTLGSLKTQLSKL